MEAVGQLTGGIAHDFNNMLAVVVGGIDLAKRRLSGPRREVLHHLTNAMEGATRAAALTRRLLSFARSEPLLPERVDSRDLVTGMSELLDRTLGERTKVVTRLDGDAWPVFVDSHQLENAILNLAVNARDAMDGAGTLTISTDNILGNSDDREVTTVTPKLSVNPASGGAPGAKETTVRFQLPADVAPGDYFLGVRGGVAEAAFAGPAVAITQVAIVAGGTVDDAVVTQPTAVGQTVLAVAGAGNARMRVILDAA
jgi:hypothetical protein